SGTFLSLRNGAGGAAIGIGPEPRAVRTEAPAPQREASLSSGTASRRCDKRDYAEPWRHDRAVGRPDPAPTTAPRDGGVDRGGGGGLGWGGGGGGGPLPAGRGHGASENPQRGEPPAGGRPEVPRLPLPRGGARGGRAGATLWSARGPRVFNFPRHFGIDASLA